MARLTVAQRRKLPQKAFALKKKKGGEAGDYPLTDAAGNPSPKRAAAAKRFAARFATPSEKAIIDRKADKIIYKGRKNPNAKKTRKSNRDPLSEYMANS